MIWSIIHRAGLGDAGRKLAEFDPVELVDVDDRQGVGQRVELFAGMDLLQQRDLQRAQFAVGDDQEIAAAAGRIKEPQPREPVLETQQIGPPAAVPAGLQTPGTRRGDRP